MSLLLSRINHLVRAAIRYCALLPAALVFGAGGTASAESNPVLSRFEQLRAQDLRVASVAYRLATANEIFCKPVLTPQFGFVLHSLQQYAWADRPEAVREFDLGSHVGVMVVVGGSPAQKAGLAAGDQLLAVNGRSLGEDAADGLSRASVDRAQQILVEEMRLGAITLRISSPQGVHEIRFAAESGCPSSVELIPGEAVNAWADGSRVMISDALLSRCATDDDLALVIGHEMAHNLLRHRQRLAAEGVFVNGLLPLSEAGSIAMRETEEEADRLAVSLATTAAYDLSGVEAFIGGLMDRGVIAATHPDLPRRLSLLHAAIADARRGTGVPVRLSGWTLPSRAQPRSAPPGRLA